MLGEGDREKTQSRDRKQLLKIGAVFQSVTAEVVLEGGLEQIANATRL